jgi:PAS domain S-box-containing protein
MKKLKQMPAGELLLFTFGIQCAILLIVGGFFFFSLRSIEQSNRLQQSRTWIKMDLLDDTELSVEQMQAEVLRQVLTTDAGEMTRLDQIVRNLDNSNAAEFANYQKSVAAQKEGQLYGRVMRTRRLYWEQTDAVLGFCLTNRVAEATELILSKQAPAYDELLIAIKELTDYAEADAVATANATSRSISELRTIGNALIGFTMLIIVGTGFSVARVGRRLKDDNQLLQIEVTERKRAEEALRRQQIELRVLFDLMPAMLCFKDTENRLLRVNRRLAEATGKSVEEIEGKSALELYPREAASYYADDLEVIRSGAPKLGIVETLRGPEGQELWVQTDKVPYRDRGGKVIGIVVMIQDVTERHRAATASLESKRFLRSALDALSSHIAILDEHGTIIEVNAAWNHFGSKNDLAEGHRGVGWNYLQVCDAASGNSSQEAPAVAVGIRAIIAGRTDEFQLEYPCHSPMEKRWFNVRVTRFGGDGPVRVVVAHENITKRKRAEEELRWKTAFLEAQVNSSIDGILLVDPNGNRSLQNQRFIEMFKIPESIASEVTNENRLRWGRQMLVVKDQDQFSKKVAYLYAHPQETSRDELELKDGTVLDRYSAPVMGENGKHYGRIWTYRDITDKKRMEKRMRRLVDSDVQGIFFWNTKGAITEANDAFLKLVGHTREDLDAGRVNWAAMTPQEYAHLDRHALDQIFANGVCTHYEKEYIRKDGSRVSILIGAATFDDNREEGAVRGEGSR